MQKRVKAISNRPQPDDNELAHYRLPKGLFNPEEALPHCFTVVSNRISLTLFKMYSKRFGLSVTGWRLMGILSVRSPLSAKALSELTAIDQASMSRAIDQLARKKLISRKVARKDRRRVELRLSKQGMAVYEQIIPIVFAEERALVSILSEGEVDLLRSLMKKLVAHSADVLGPSSDWRALLSDFGHRISCQSTTINARPSSESEKT